MSDILWRPLKIDREAMNRGNRKIALHWKIKEKGGKESECSFCGKPVLIFNDKTTTSLTGSSHNCVKKKEYDKYHGEKIDQ